MRKEYDTEDELLVTFLQPNIETPLRQIEILKFENDHCRHMDIQPCHLKAPMHKALGYDFDIAAEVQYMKNCLPFYDFECTDKLTLKEHLERLVEARRASRLPFRLAGLGSSLADDGDIDILGRVD